ncbi:MAG TPA: radical SAM protein [Myxococcota bacterium]|nr:radical SAM protein [Myxococcota bacterium]HQK50785.1 radical SAM protein [Myxococcota bacterium]
MAAIHYRTLTIETGVWCGNRCSFCYQQAYRALPDYPRLVPGEEIRRRMQWGLSHGYDEVSFTGGEPTIRPDFLDLIRAAREMGYRRVAVTTNGSRLSDPTFFAQAVEAGLTSMGVSIHGPDAATHEGATGRQGSFGRALRAIHHAVATHGTLRPVRLNTFTVVHRGNVGRLLELARVLAGLGVRLLVFQPAILGKSNFREASRVQVGIEEIVEGLRPVILEGMERDFRVKLFNLPPCLFRDVLEGLDLDSYREATFREHDQDAPLQNDPDQETGSVETPACASCDVRSTCPRIHVTLLPQEDLAAHFEESLLSIAAWDHPQVWLSGTDLMRPATLYRVVRKARLNGFEEVLVTTGGTSLWDGRAGWIAMRQGGASRLVLVHHARDPRSSDRMICHAGNDANLLELVGRWRQEAPEGLGLGVLVPVSENEWPFLESEGIRGLEGIEWDLLLRAPWRTEGRPALQVRRIRDFVARARRLPSRPRSVVLHVPWPRRWEAAALPGVAIWTRGRLRFDLAGTVLPTAFVEPRYSVLNWSLPHLGGQVLCSPGDRRVPLRPLLARSIQVQGITRETLFRVRRRDDGPGGPAGP